MFERFTDQARQAVIDAQAEARSLHYGYLGTEHLLLGLLYDPADLPARVLARHGVELANARDQVEDVIGERRDTTTGHIPSPHARRPYWRSRSGRHSSSGRTTSAAGTSCWR